MKTFHKCPDCKCKGPISRKETAQRAAAARWAKRTAQSADTVSEKELDLLAEEPEKDWENEE